MIGFIFTGCTNNHIYSENHHEINNTMNESIEQSLLSPNRILNIAHRGASGHAPEHTMESYRLGEEMNGDYIEIDLQMTKDGTLIAMHDEDVSRTSHQEGLVSDLTIEEIKQLDVGSWFNERFPHLANSKFTNLTVPTLDEIVTEFGTSANYYIETKQPNENPGMTNELIRVLQEHDLINQNVREGQVIIQSFSEESLKEIHKLEPSLPIIQLISYTKKAKISMQELENIREYAVGIGVNYKHLSQKYIQQVRDAGLLIHPYTVNEKSKMKQLIDWGVTGMFTNYPDRLDEVINHYQSRGRSQ